EGVEGHDGRQAPVDGGGLETTGRLGHHEGIHIVESNGSRWLVANHGHKLLQVVAVIAPGARLRVTPAHPAHNTVNVVAHDEPPELSRISPTERRHSTARRMSILSTSGGWVVKISDLSRRCSRAAIRGRGQDGNPTLSITTSTVSITLLALRIQPVIVLA